LRRHVDFDVDVASSICGNDLPKLTNSTSISRATNQSGRPLLNHREQQHHLRGDDRERTTSARQAAEAPGAAVVDDLLLGGHFLRKADVTQALDDGFVV